MGKSNIIRLLYAIMYTCTSIINLIIALTSYEMISSLADTALIPLLGDIIRSVPEYMYFLGLLFFMVSQIIFAILLLSKGVFVKLGLLGAIVFHISIVPFGWFNFLNIFIAIPLIILLKKDFTKTIPDLIFTKKIQSNIDK